MVSKDFVPKICNHEGCELKTRRNGLCGTHDSQFKSKGMTWDIGSVSPGKPCNWKGCKNLSVSGNATRCENHRGRCPINDGKNYCTRTTFSKDGKIAGDVCSLHHARMATYGDYGGPGRRRNEWTRRGAGPDGKTLNGDGYVMVPAIWPDGTMRNKLEHRAVMEEHLERFLITSENVHHVNGDRTDNRLENLELWSTSQPKGQRVEDKTAWAIEWLKRYAPELLK